MSAIVICSPAMNLDFFNCSSNTERLNVLTSPNYLNAYASAGTYPNTCNAYASVFTSSSFCEKSSH